MRYEAMTGLTAGQLAEVAARVHALGGEWHAVGRPYALGLYRSVVMVIALMRTNITQDFAGAIFGVSQPTTSRRWDLLRPKIAEAMAEFIPDPTAAARGSTVLVDGTVCPTWDWHAVPDLYSGKAGYAGMNIQIAASLDGDLLAVGPVPVHGARHDAHAFAASELATALEGLHTLADLGYVGVDGIDIVPIKRVPGVDPDDSQTQFNTQLSAIRAAAEHAVAHLKTWRMLSEQGGRYRPPLDKYESTLHAITGLFFFSRYE